MKSASSTSNDPFIVTSGIGISNYSLREEGKFQVRYHNKVRDFKTLVGSCLFYMSLKEEATIWDMTIEPILIESKIVIH
jgi:hypothetical protein